MTFGILFDQREIVLVPLPFSNLSTTKQRPVLILSKNEDNAQSDDIITCGITSNLKESKHSVIIEQKDLESGYLPSASRIKIDKLFTLEKSIVIKRMGKLNKSSFEDVKREFFKLL